jgi:hypothetical protein
MTAALLLVVGLAFVAGLVAVMIRIGPTVELSNADVKPGKLKGASVPSQATSSAPALTRVDAVPRR